MPRASSHWPAAPESRRPRPVSGRSRSLTPGSPAALACRSTTSVCPLFISATIAAPSWMGVCRSSLNGKRPFTPAGGPMVRYSVAESGRGRGGAVVADEAHAGPRAVPAQVGRLVTEGGIAGDRVEIRIASAEHAGAHHDDATGVELLALVALHAVLGDLGLGGAEQQDAAALERRRFVARLAELVVAEHAVALHNGIACPARLAIVEHEDSLAVPGGPVVHDGHASGVPDENAERVPRGDIVANHRGRVRRIPDVEAGLAVAYGGVVGEQGL